jgi:mannose/fructose/N-acetylgalactosamine-specific phosphotransferase system component IIB
MIKIEKRLIHVQMIMLVLQHLVEVILEVDDEVDDEVDEHHIVEMVRSEELKCVI